MSRLIAFSVLFLIAFSALQQTIDAKQKCFQCCQTEKDCASKGYQGAACVYGNCEQPEDNCRSDSDCAGINCSNYGRCRCTHGQCA